MVGPVPPPYGGIASLVDDIVHSELSHEYCFDIFPRTGIFPPWAKGPFSRHIFRMKRFASFFNTVRKGNYAFVHIHSAVFIFEGTVILVLLARLAGAKVILHLHGTDWGHFFGDLSGLRCSFRQLGLSYATRIVVLYSLWADNVRAICPGADVRIIKNLIHRVAPPDPADVQRARAALGLEKGDFVVLEVGTVGRRKGTFEILKAVPKVVSQDEGIRFVFVGGEEGAGEMGQLMDVVVRDKLAPWVRFTGEVERDIVPLFLAMADVFLLPSFIEGMPISIIEAMRSGVSVIATRIAAIPDMIEDEVSGLLINPGAPDEIAEAVLRLRIDPSLRARLAEGGKKVFEERFEFSRGIEEIRDLYRSI